MSTAVTVTVSAKTSRCRHSAELNGLLTLCDGHQARGLICRRVHFLIRRTLGPSWMQDEFVWGKRRVRDSGHRCLRKRDDRHAQSHEGKAAELSCAGTFILLAFTTLHVFSLKRKPRTIFNELFFARLSYSNQLHLLYVGHAFSGFI